MKELIKFSHYGITITAIHDLDAGRYYLQGKGKDTYFSTLDEVRVYFDQKVQEKVNRWAGSAQAKADLGKDSFTREEYFAACHYRGATKGLKGSSGFLWGFVAKCYESYLSHEELRKLRNGMRYNVRHYKCGKNGKPVRAAADLTGRFKPAGEIVPEATKIRKAAALKAGKGIRIAEGRFRLENPVETMPKGKIGRLFAKYGMKSPIRWMKEKGMEMAVLADTRNRFMLTAHEIINLFHVEGRAYPTFCLVSRNGFDILLQFKSDRWNINYKNNRAYEKDLYSHLPLA